MLKIHSVKTNNPCAMLEPFFKSPASNTNDPDNGRYDEYTKNAKLYFAMVDPAEADIIVYPTDWNKLDQELLQRLSKLTSSTKPLVIFHNDDNATPIDIENTIVYRTSMHRSNKKPYEYGLPAWSKDPITSLTIKHKESKPSVGFCGVCQTPLRNQLVAKLSQCETLDTNFVCRDNFWAGAMGESGFTAAARTRRLEFIDNILSNDFTLCPPGSGNFSYRLYETMSCGRIPIIPDTGQVLPYSETINWESVAVFVTFENVEQKILQTYNMTDLDYEDKQRKIRDVWKHYLSPNGFFSKLEHHIRCMNQK
jgi:hypothetical protein